MLGLQQRGLPGEAAMAMASSAAFTTDAAALSSGEAPPSRQVKTNPSIFCFVFQVLSCFCFFPSFLVHEGRKQGMAEKVFCFTMQHLYFCISRNLVMFLAMLPLLLLLLLLLLLW